MPPDPTPPPAGQPARCRVRVEGVGGDLELHYAPRHWAIAVFLTAFLVGWSAGCVLIVTEALGGGGWWMWLFATPFLAAWCFLFWALQQALFGWERLRIGPRGMVHEQRGVLGIRRRELPLDEVQSFAVAMTSGGDDSPPQSYVRIRALGKPLEFGKGLNEKEVRWLVELLESHCSVLRGDVEPMQADDGDTEHRTSNIEHPTSNVSTLSSEPSTSDVRPAEAARVEVLVQAERPIEPPSDCGYYLRQGFDGLHFEKRGRWNLAGIVAITLVNAFWNGIVGVFVWQLFREFQWFLFFFLVPFELVGLVLVLLWIGAMFAPAFLDAWSFGGYEVSRRTSFLGFGHTKRYPIMSLDRIELREYPPTRAGNRQQVEIAGKLGDFSLALIKRDGQELLEIKRLTEGEARWMADAVYRNFSMWFPRR
jgi:hypothetical protein